MKKLASLVLFVISLSGFSQILNPVKWEFGSQKISETEYELIFFAKMDHHWALYSQFVEEGGPLPTVFSFESSADFELIEAVTEAEINKVTQHDPVFDMVVSKYYDTAIFKQRIKVKSSEFFLGLLLLFSEFSEFSEGSGFGNIRISNNSNFRIIVFNYNSV